MVNLNSSCENHVDIADRPTYVQVADREMDKWTDCSIDGQTDRPTDGQQTDTHISNYRIASLLKTTVLNSENIEILYFNDYLHDWVVVFFDKLNIKGAVTIMHLPFLGIFVYY